MGNSRSAQQFIGRDFQKRKKAFERAREERSISKAGENQEHMPESTPLQITRQRASESPPWCIAWSKFLGGIVPIFDPTPREE
jgi:hypothetical protein